MLISILEYLSTIQLKLYNVVCCALCYLCGNSHSTEELVFDGLSKLHVRLNVAMTKVPVHSRDRWTHTLLQHNNIIM